MFSNIYHTAKAAVSAVQKWQEMTKLVKPKRPFDPSTTPDPLDYFSLHSWAAHPQKKSKALLVPPGETLAIDPKVDVFFVHPTTYFGKDNWNQPFGHQPSSILLDEMIMAAQASVFNGSCRIFAPKFRQATFYVFLTADGNASQALELAYTDVEKAFDHYLRHFNNGRPFIIASHSQGTVHAVRLLEEKIDPSEKLVQQMVAAYTVGFQFPMDKFTRTLQRIKPSSSPTDLHTVVAWDTFGYGGTPKSPLDRTRHWYKDTRQWEMRHKKKNFGINPLTFTDHNEVAGASLNLGALRVEYEKPFSFGAWWKGDEIDMNATALAAPFKNEVSAELKPDRFVYISEPKHRDFKLAMLPGKNYHNYDYSLFYMNLRKNIGDRVRTYEKA